jgi:hypothetical protein
MRLCFLAIGLNCRQGLVAGQEALGIIELASIGAETQRSSSHNRSMEVNRHPTSRKSPDGSIRLESRLAGKLRDDQRAAKADVALIVSSAVPKEVQMSFDLIENVWVAEPRFAIPLAVALRQSLIDIATSRKAQEGQQTKTEVMYAYLTGPRFRHRIEAIVEKFTDMKADLNRERTAMTRLWAKRQEQLDGVLDSTAGLYGDLQGIAGSAMQEIKSLDVPMIEVKGEAAE